MCLLACHSSVSDGFTIPQKAKTLLQILAEELPKHGGWPEGVAAMAQDADGAVQNYSDTDDIGINAPHAYGNSRIPYSYSIVSGEVSAASDRLTAIITRDQYESAVLAATTQATITTDADYWIDWAGGECPVDSEEIINIRHRDGCEYEVGEAGKFRWTHMGWNGDIIAYRLHQPQEGSLLDDLVEREMETRETIAQATDDLNECIGQVRTDEDVLRDHNLAKCDHCGRVGEIGSKCDHGAEDTTLLTHSLLDEMRDSGVNLRLDDAYELAAHMIYVGYRKQ